MTEAEQHRQLRRIWNEVVSDNTAKQEWWYVRETLRIFNGTYKDMATSADLTEALENMGDVYR